MRKDDQGALRCYRFESLPEADLDVFVTTRQGGASLAPFAALNLGLRVGDVTASVLDNRRLVFDTFGLDLGRSVWCRQVHADGVTVVGEEDAGRGAYTEDTIVTDTDALVTAVPGVPLCVTLADCVPVVIHDRRLSVLGLAHAGWGGTVSRIASRTVATMASRFGCKPSELTAAIGPSIGPRRYEVGGDVIDRARESFGARVDEVIEPVGDGDKARFDLWIANRIDLEEAGVSANRIEVAEISTDEHLDEFYSHRVEGGTGRFIAAASLRRH